MFISQARSELFTGLTDATRKRKMACAIYEVVYKRAEKETKTNNKSTTDDPPTKINNFPYSFVWNVAVELLCEIKVFARRGE